MTCPTPLRELPITQLTLPALLNACASEYTTDALVFPEGRLTFPELAQHARSMAQSLRGLGVRPGDKVAMFMPNTIDYAVAMFATAEIGAVIVPVNGRFKTSELGHVLGHSETSVLITAVAADGPNASFGDTLLSVFPELTDATAGALELAVAPQLRTIVNLGQADLPWALDAAAFADVGTGVSQDEVNGLAGAVTPPDEALLMYTSGTTAAPKGCLISHRAIVHQAIKTGQRGIPLEPGDAFWDPMPLFHTGGILLMLSCLAQGCVFCHPGHFEPEAAIEMIERERCRMLYVMFDTIWIPIIDHPRFATADLSAIEYVWLVGPPARMRFYQQRTPQFTLLSAFGMTEVCAHLALAGPFEDEETCLTTAGPIQPEMEAKIIHPETGAEQPPGEPGELLYRGPFLFNGYYKQEELTREVIDAEGYFHSGDLGIIDTAGRFTFRGRLKDMLKVGGENVSPLEIEGLLGRHPAVAIAQVVSAPDAYYVEVPAAFVQLRPGATATEEELIEHCLGTIATFKVPRYVRFVDEWPMSGTKIQKFVLRQRIAQELEQAGITEAPRLKASAAS